MAQTIREIMTTSPVTLAAEASIAEAAVAMREHNVGDIIVLKEDRMCGLVTDRDLVVRAIAQRLDPEQTSIGEICSRELSTLSPDDDVEAAIRLVRQRAVRRVPIIEDGRPVGILSLGDLAIQRDGDSALAAVSAAAPNS